MLLSAWHKVHTIELETHNLTMGAAREKVKKKIFTGQVLTRIRARQCPRISIGGFQKAAVSGLHTQCKIAKSLSSHSSQGRIRSSYREAHIQFSYPRECSREIEGVNGLSCVVFGTTKHPTELSVLFWKRRGIFSSLTFPPRRSNQAWLLMISGASAAHRADLSSRSDPPRAKSAASSEDSCLSQTEQRTPARRTASWQGPGSSSLSVRIAACAARRQLLSNWRRATRRSIS